MICTAALVAAISATGCSNMGSGKQTTSHGVEITQQQADNCPDGNCPDDECPDDECPDGKCKDGKCKDGDDNDKCPKGDCPDGKCPKKGRKGRKGKPVFPRASFKGHKRKPHHPKLPVQPPEDDIIIPDPPVEDPIN